MIKTNEQLFFRKQTGIQYWGVDGLLILAVLRHHYFAKPFIDAGKILEYGMSAEEQKVRVEINDFLSHDFAQYFAHNPSLKALIVSESCFSYKQAALSLHMSKNRKFRKSVTGMMKIDTNILNTVQESKKAKKNRWRRCMKNFIATMVQLILHENVTIRKIVVE
jgi:hypothetical protein